MFSILKEFKKSNEIVERLIIQGESSRRTPKNDDRSNIFYQDQI